MPSSTAAAAASRVGHVTVTGAYLYPIKGVVYFATHSFLYPFLRSRIIPAILLSTFVLVTLFFTVYLPQVAFLAIFHGRGGAFLNATFLVLGEGAAITAILFEAFLVDEAMLNTFDTVLVAQGLEGLVETSRPVLPETEETSVTPPAQAMVIVRNARERLGKLNDRGAVYSPFSFRQIAEFVLLLPLNLVPWIGVPLFLWLTGYRAGPLHHYRLFKLKGWNKRERAAHVKTRSLGYTSFGCVALVLQLVPVLSMVFLLTTAVGSALWVVDMERELRSRDDAQGANAMPDGPPPEYSEYVDDPV